MGTKGKGSDYLINCLVGTLAVTGKRTTVHATFANAGYEKWVMMLNYADGVDDGADDDHLGT